MVASGGHDGGERGDRHGGGADDRYDRLDVDATSVGHGLCITGNAGDNVLVGTDFNDVLNGGGGDDFGWGLGEQRTLIGGTGNDGLDGTSGDNTLIGGAWERHLRSWTPLPTWSSKR